MKGNVLYMCVQFFSAHSHHHQHILTDAFPQTVREAILKSLFLGFISVLNLFLLQLVLEPDPSCGQLKLHEMLEALVDVSRAICLVQLPQVLLNQGLPVPLHHHTGETGKSWKLCRTCVCICWDSYCNFFNLPVKPVESDSTQKCCTCLWILWIEAALKVQYIILYLSHHFEFRSNKKASIWVLRYLFYKLLGFRRDISHSRENKCNQFQPKRNVEKAKTRDITDLSLMVKDECKKDI